MKMVKQRFVLATVVVMVMVMVSKIAWAEYITSYNGVTVSGQCVDFVRRYASQVLGSTIPSIGQYHSCSLSGYDSCGAHWIWDDSRLQPTSTDRIANDGNNFPQSQDIIVWSSAIAGGFGHIAIVDSASSRSNVVVVDSNWSLDERGQRHTIAINGNVLGWFRKQGGPPGCDPGKKGDGGTDNRILDAYNNNGGSGRVGNPIDNGGGQCVHEFNGGRIQDFDGGSAGKGAILHQQNDDNVGTAYYIQGEFWEAFLNRYGSTGGRLGWPTADRAGAGRSPQGSDGAYQNFEHGQIYSKYRPDGQDVFEVHGSIEDKYNESGRPWAGSGGVLGFPTSDESDAASSPQGTTGRLNRFEGGSIYWSGPHGAHPVYGAIGNIYESNGGTAGRYGFPKSDPIDGACGKQQDFEGATIYENSPVAPPAPSLISPSDGAWLNGTPTLSWNAVDGGCGGTVEYFKEVAGIGNGGWSTDRTWVPPTLTPGTTYQWRVRARSAGGGEGAYSPYYSFHVNVPPNKPSLLGPANDTVSTSRTVRFCWNDPGDSDNGPNVAREYRLIVDHVGDDQDYDSGWGVLDTCREVTLQADGEFTWYVLAGDGISSSLQSDSQRLKVSPYFNISGRIAHSNGSAIEGVSVTLTGSSSPVLTNNAGYYLFTNVPAATYTLTPRKTGYVFSPESQDLRVSNADRAANFVGTPTSQTYRIHGRIATSSSQAMTGVKVMRSGSSVPVETNSAGYYIFNNVPNGTYTITPSLSGHGFMPASKTVTVNNVDVLNQNFVGGPGYKIHGRISNSAGVAIPNVSVTRNGLSTPVLANSAGYYVFENVINGTYSVTPTLNGYNFVPTSKTVTVSNADMLNQNFVGGQPYTIQGRIVNSSGTGIANVTVLRSGSSTPAMTNVNGEYQFSNVPFGTYTIAPIRTDNTFTPASRTVTASSPTANFTMLFTISGLVRSSTSVGIQGVSVTRTGSSIPVTTNASGYYIFTGVSSGNYYLTASKSGYTFSPTTQSLAVTTANRAAHFNGAPTAPTYKIHGRIATSRGIAIPNVSVMRSGSSSPVFTNSAGYYVFPNVPNGSYAITPNKSGYTFSPVNKTATINNADAVNQNFIGSG